MRDKTPAVILRHARAAIALVATLVGTAFGVTAAAQAYRIAPERTTAGFVMTELGILRQEGRFRRMSGTILLDPARAGGSIDVAVDLSSVDTGWQVRDDFIRSEDMLDVARYPLLHFRSTRLVYHDRQIVAAEGAVTLHGVTKPMRFEVHRIECSRDAGDDGETCGASVSGRLLRREFGLEFAYPFVGDAILLDFAITAVRVRDEGETAVREPR
jgi:polyisoprenoid-binding protein YceI